MAREQQANGLRLERVERQLAGCLETALLTADHTLRQRDRHTVAIAVQSAGAGH